MPSYKTKAIILKTYDLGEADKIIKLFSQDRGMVDAVAKGARKIKSKFAGRLALFNFIDGELSQGKTLDIITQAEIIKSFQQISSDFNKYLFCQLISEVIIRTHLTDTENSSQLFKLIYVCFNEMDMAKPAELDSLLTTTTFFLAKFLKITGYLPIMSDCCRCGVAINHQETCFSIRLGGLLCKNCIPAEENFPGLKKNIGKEEYQLLFSLFNFSLKEIKKNCGSGGNFQNIEKIAYNICRLLGDYISYHTDCNLDFSLYLKRLVI